MFIQTSITKRFAFNDLIDSIDFQHVVNGRLNANLVDSTDKIPIVRTTTLSDASTQLFKPIHLELMDEISKTIPTINRFNSAMVEIYDDNYRKMKFHTDQALDLDTSIICIFTSYETPPERNDFRTFQHKNKLTNEIQSIKIENNSIITFSTAHNQQHLHKIILTSHGTTNRWLGITFRLSKTFIHFKDEIPYFYNTTIQLTIANEEQRRLFIKCKSDENRKIDFVYPEIDFTLSNQDLLMVKS